MEKLMPALMSLIIVAAVIMRRRSDGGAVAFATVCFFVACWRGAAYLAELQPGYHTQVVELVGLAGLIPATLRFYGYLFPEDNRRLQAFYGASIFLVWTPLVVFAFLPELREVIFTLLEAILTLTAVYIFLVIRTHLRTEPDGTEKKRSEYQANLLAGILVLGFLDYLVAPSRMSLTEIGFAGFIYFNWLAVVSPGLGRLYASTVRAMGIVIVSLPVALVFILIVNLLGRGDSLDTAPVLIASLIIVIILAPLRLFIERFLARLYPPLGEVFPSLNDFNRRLEREKAELLEGMAPVLAHEIRNPLGSIKGAAQCLKADALPSQESLLGVIIEETDRLNRVVSQFMDYAKPYETQKVRQDIAPVLRRAVSLLETHFGCDKIRIENKVDVTLPPLELDAEQMIQVILNLGLNAVDAMPNGGVLTIETFMQRERDGSDTPGFSVRDTGDGIAREDLKNIFQPFFTTRKRGTGLGLAICHQIIARHGGTIRVESTVGQGTVFKICFRQLLPGDAAFLDRGDLT